MQQPNDILNELREMGSPLADMSRIMPYHVPDGYFEQMNNVLMMETGISFSANLKAGLHKAVPFAIPEGYFNLLPEQILNAAKASAYSGMDLPKEMPFAMPAGYMEQLPQQILDAAKNAEGKKAKIIPLGNRIGRSLKWAAAAILLLGIGITSYNVYNSEKPDASQQLAAIPSNVLTEYIQQNTDIEPAIANDAIAAAGYKELDRLNDEEIINYLEETGWEEPVIN